MNCSSQCDSALCFVHAGVNRQEALEVMQRLCGLSTVRTATNVPPCISAGSVAPDVLTWCLMSVNACVIYSIRSHSCAEM